MESQIYPAKPLWWSAVPGLPSCGTGVGHSLGRPHPQTVEPPEDSSCQKVSACCGFPRNRMSCDCFWYSKDDVSRSTLILSCNINSKQTAKQSFILLCRSASFDVEPIYTFRGHTWVLISWYWLFIHFFLLFVFSFKTCLSNISKTLASKIYK